MNKPSSHIESCVYNGAVGVLVELSVSDPRVLSKDGFSGLARDLAMHIAAMRPTSIEDLLSQAAVSNLNISVGHVIGQAEQQLSAEIGVVRFVRWVAGPCETDEPPRTPGSRLLG